MAQSSALRNKEGSKEDDSEQALFAFGTSGL
jgi:hypothetical protein